MDDILRPDPDLESDPIQDFLNEYFEKWTYKEPESWKADLSSESPTDREEALIALTNLRTHDRKEFIEMCEKMMLQDSNARVRAVALAGFTVSFFGTNDTSVLRRLAEWAMREDLEDEWRFQAYCGLFYVRGEVAHTKIFESKAPRTFRIPHDFDSSLINDALRS